MGRHRTTSECCGPQLFRASTVVTLGNGNKASFWQSAWLHGQAPMDIFPDLFKLAWRKNRSVREELQHQSWTRGLLENGERGRNGKLHQTLGFGTDCSADKRTRCNQMEVDKAWRVYSQDSLYNIQFAGSHSQFVGGIYLESRSRREA